MLHSRSSRVLLLVTLAAVVLVAETFGVDYPEPDKLN